MEILLTEQWEKCFQCMEEKASAVENQDVAKLWREKIEKCRACRDDYIETMKRYSIVDPLERWATTMRKCSMCMLDEMSRIAETGNVEAASSYKELLNQCFDCMFSRFDEVKNITVQVV